MAATFRTAPMGFNKKDVIEYIEKLVSDKNQNIESAWAEYKALEASSSKQMAALESDRLHERMQSAARIEELQNELEQARAAAAQLEEEKVLLEERALGSEQAFADLEAAINELRTAHEAQLEALRAAHAEELNAIYAERSHQLDKKAEQIRSLEAESADKDAELESLRACNKRLLLQVDELEQAAAAYEAIEDEEDDDELPVGSQALLAAFKTRFIEITGELSLLARAILDAEKRESRAAGRPVEDDEDFDFGNDDLLTFPVDLSDDDLPEGDGDTDDEELLAFFRDLPKEEDPEEESEPEAPAAEETSEEAPAEETSAAEEPTTRIEMTDYPDPRRAPKPVQKKGPTVRDLLGRLRTIGDRLL
ncbi:MAG: hypothetical protein IJO51_06800 [Clostridia bacterium]|nr:hypothetical protein [Clostridia bacterium]